MPQPPLDYATPLRAPTQARRAWVAATCLIFAWVIANLVLFAASRSVSDGFKGMAVEVFGAIVLNALLLIVAIALSFWVRRAASPMAVAVFLGAAALPPAAAVGGALWIIYG